jgi:hypothetical protein
MPRRQKLKVYGGNVDGQHRVIMATTSLKLFRAACGLSSQEGCETGNQAEIDKAMSEPGVIFAKRGVTNLPYFRVSPPPLSWKALAEGSALYSGKH